MNINISYNWLKEYIKISKSAKDFAEVLSLSGPSVDRIIEFGEDLKGVVVGKLVEKKKHPGADKLNVGQIDVGKKTIQVVFGQMAEIKEGDQLAVAIAPTTLPAGEIKRVNLRGVESEGMLCLDSELGISDEEKVTFFDKKIKPGTPLNKAMKLLNDEILDVEITSNRPDAMSIVGIAREAAAIFGVKFLYQDPAPNIKPRASVKLSVNNKETKLCPRYQAIVMGDVKVEPSPLWMQQRLNSAGLRPINNLVDITNYVLLEFGQPMHVFDFNKLKGNQINVRSAKRGEKILALDGKSYELSSDNLVIADKSNPVAIAGVMGGELSAATNNTKTIVLECANFNPIFVRQTARLLNLHSESSDLFEKNLPPEGTTPALMRAIELVNELTGGKVASKVFDDGHFKSRIKEINFAIENINKVLGVGLKYDEVQKILTSLGFEVSAGKTTKVKVPWWRQNDIEGEHDLIEEVARIYGYHQLPSNLPIGVPTAEIINQNEFFWEDKVKDILMALGLSEAYNYSFISEKNIKNSFLNIENHIKVANQLSADFKYMRTSLAPGILQNIADNQNNYKEIKIFELSNVYLKKEKDLPNEQSRICLAIANDSTEETFFDLKGVLESLLERLNIGEWKLAPLEEERDYWQKEKTVAIKINNEIIGYLGVVNKEVLHLCSIKVGVSLVEIDFAKLSTLAKTSPAFKKASKYPQIELDISMEIDEKVLYQEVAGTIKAEDPLIKNVCFLSVFQDEKIPSGKKALAIRIIYRDEKKTLKSVQAQKVHDMVVTKLKKEYNITIR